MRRTEVTYGELDKVLRSLGFTCRLLKDRSPVLLYEHESGAEVVIPQFPESDFVLDYHLVAARTVADLFGIADPKTFDALFRKAAG
jgi:hypothetical protein